MNVNKKVFAAWMLAFAATAVSVSAEDSEIKVEQSVTLTVDQAVEYALKNSRTLKSADIDLEIKERAAKYGWNIFLPNVQVTGTMSRATEYSPSSAATSQMMSMITRGAYPAKTDFAI